MQIAKSRWTCGILIGILAACLGCPGGQPTNPPTEGNAAAGKPSAAPTDRGTAKEGATDATAVPPAAPVEKPKIPEVHLTEDLQKSSHIRVGSSVPDAELPDLAGNRHAVRSLFGKRLTILVFFKGNGIYDRMLSSELLQDMQRDVATAYGKDGISVIAVDVRDEASVAREIAGEAKASFPVLLDADGAYFDQFASEKLPRIYAIDPSGKVLWFDLEYSPTTRYGLKQTILFLLGETPGNGS